MRSLASLLVCLLFRRDEEARSARPVDSPPPIDLSLILRILRLSPFAEDFIFDPVDAAAAEDELPSLEAEEDPETDAVTLEAERVFSFLRSSMGCLTLGAFKSTTKSCGARRWNHWLEMGSMP